MAEDKKGALEQGISIAFIDETGCMLEPLVKRTWSPRGVRPVVKVRHGHGRVSVISALTICPGSGKAGFFFQISRRNFKGDDINGFAQQVVQEVATKVVVVWDRLPGHKSAASKLKKQLGDHVQIEWLPVYAPELNPVEQVWTHTKYGELANYAPDDLDELEATLQQRLDDKRDAQDLLISFFAAAGLPL